MILRPDIAVYATKNEDAVRKYPRYDMWGLSGPFESDRNKIMGCDSLGVLKKKTQIFFDPCKDGYKTRLTHTLQVAKIGRTIARCWGLNEDLVEAIAWAHDIGHGPLGHAGDDILDRLNPKGFSHYKQGPRIVEHIEELNLTEQVIDGIANHGISAQPKTLEGYASLWADKIAYVCYDIQDGLLAKCFEPKDIPKIFVGIGGCGEVPQKKELITQYFEYHEQKLIEMLVRGAKVKDRQIVVPEGFMDIIKAVREDFIPEYVHKSRDVQDPEKSASIAIVSIYNYYLKNPDKVPRLANVESTLEDRICDYIVSCSDSKIRKKIREIDPKLGNKLFGLAEGTPVQPPIGRRR